MLFDFTHGKWMFYSELPGGWVNQIELRSNLLVKHFEVKWNRKVVSTVQLNVYWETPPPIVSLPIQPQSAQNHPLLYNIIN